MSKLYDTVADNEHTPACNELIVQASQILDKAIQLSGSHLVIAAEVVGDHRVVAFTQRVEDTADQAIGELATTFAIVTMKSFDVLAESPMADELEELLVGAIGKAILSTVIGAALLTEVQPSRPGEGGILN